MASHVKPSVLMATIQGTQLMDPWTDEPVRSAWEIVSPATHDFPAPNAKTLPTSLIRRSASENVQHHTILMVPKPLKVAIAWSVLACAVSAKGLITAPSAKLRHFLQLTALVMLHAKKATGKRWEERCTPFGE